MCTCRGKEAASNLCVYLQGKLRAGWDLPDGFTLLVGQFILLFGGSECPWDGHRVARLGRLSPQVNLGGDGGQSHASQVFPRYHHHHHSMPGPAFSHRVPVCWWSQKQKVGARRPDGVCEALSVGSVRQGTEVLSHKACSVSPGSWAAFLSH